MTRRVALSIAIAGWLALAALAGTAFAVAPSGPTPAAGPPYPPPVNDVVVYDYADLFSASTDAAATQIIVGIEQRVGAEVVVYTQYKPGSDFDSTAEDARALINQWGVGRQGFDDGLAIFVNMNRRECIPGASGNGQVQLYAAPGYQATYLSNAERQQIFDNDMLPLLRQCDFDAALLVALQRVDQNASPEHAQALQTARFIDAAIGLVGAPLLFVLVIGWALRSWLLYGRDPVYLDSPSILMPAPPANLTAASGATVWEGRATRRALTVALLDLASRGEMGFRPEKKLLSEKAGIQLQGGDTSDPYVVRNRRRPLSGAEEYLLKKLHGLGASTGDGYLDSEALQGLAPSVGKFTEQIEAHVTRQGWFREPPGKATGRWAGRGTLVLVIGFVGIGIAFSIPSSGLLLLGGALVAAGIGVLIISPFMPARTMPGAMIYAMLAAYRRTLHKTMEQSRSMNEVVQRAQLDWLETPDQAVVWGVALGLHTEVEAVLRRSVEDVQHGVTGHQPWLPLWYGAWAGSSPGGSGGGQLGIAPGLMSSSVLPNFGGMMAALGSVGVAPSSSGGGSGGFSGGGGGGGGGGAGGGF
ncbi:MAG TPA: TPM domain-containing protein [Candidatus Limnocylindrales bacterium]